jgi:hypothetical protein
LQSSITSKILTNKANPSGRKPMEHAKVSTLRGQCWPAPRLLRRGRCGGLCGRPARLRQRCRPAPPEHGTLRVHGLPAVKNRRRSKPVSSGSRGYHLTPPSPHPRRCSSQRDADDDRPWLASPPPAAPPWLRATSSIDEPCVASVDLMRSGD